MWQACQIHLQTFKRREVAKRRSSEADEIGMCSVPGAPPGWGSKRAHVGASGNLRKRASKESNLMKSCFADFASIFQVSDPSYADIPCGRLKKSQLCHRTLLRAVRHTGHGGLVQVCKGTLCGCIAILLPWQQHWIWMLGSLGWLNRRLAQFWNSRDRWLPRGWGGPFWIIAHWQLSNGFADQSYNESHTDGKLSYWHQWMSECIFLTPRCPLVMFRFHALYPRVHGHSARFCSSEPCAGGATSTYRKSKKSRDNPNHDWPNKTPKTWSPKYHLFPMQLSECLSRHLRLNKGELTELPKSLSH